MRRFTGRALVAAAAVLLGYVAAQMLSTRAPAGASLHSDLPAVRDPTSAELPGVDGNLLIGRVLDALERRPNIAAEFRQLLHLGDDPLSGVGEYRQQGVGNQRRTAWTWNSVVAGQSARFTQVFDRNGHLWTDKRLAQARTVTRIDLTSVRRELSATMIGAGQGGAGSNLHKLEVLTRGGLSQLIAELQRAFNFGPAIETIVEGRTMLVALGRWRPEALVRDWPDLPPATIAGWPIHLPHHVVVYVGPVDLFPYAVEYRRGTDAALASDSPAVVARNPLARYEFFNVSYAATMPERLFEFPSTEVEWHDETSRVVARLMSAPAPLREKTARRPDPWRR